MKYSQITGMLLALALIATACGGGSSTDTVAAGSESSDTSSDSGESSDSDESSGSDESSDSGASTVDDGAPSMAASSPIGAFFADGGGFESALQEYTIKVEEQIVVCMAAEGFEFGRSDNSFSAVQDQQNDLTIREWTTEFGYGISTSFDSILQSQSTDPNAEIVFSLSEAERELWIETLTGGAFGPGADLENQPPLEEQGCIGEALIATGGQEAIEGIETFSDAYDEGEEALFDRREMVEVVNEWSRCMGEAGYPGMVERGDPEAQVSEEFTAIQGPMQAALDDLSEEEGQALFSGESVSAEDLPDLDLDALRDLQKREIELALVDLDCYEAEVRDVYEPLRDEFENGLLDEYSTEFDALKNIGS